MHAKIPFLFWIDKNSIFMLFLLITFPLFYDSNYKLLPKPHIAYKYPNSIHFKAKSIFFCTGD